VLVDSGKPQQRQRLVTGSRRIADRPRVLLLWPGGLFGGGANFGVPQLLSIARVLEARADAIVDVIDLDMERALGPFDPTRLARENYDVVGISCYSSFDYLKVMALGELVRSQLPRAWLVTGGYHPSARPGDFTRDGAPFDYVVVGDGELALARLVQALVAGKRPLGKVLGPEANADPSECIPYRWELLEKYRPVAHRVATQAEIYLSRGCPYDCAFCMERAKRDTSWRAVTPEEAVEEMHRLDRFLDLSDWSLFVADALFGMKRAWRRQFLEALARHPIRAIRTWLLIRIDLLEREDVALMARANVSPGFGLESGDTRQLRRIRKTGQLEGYLDKMLEIADWCRQDDVPFGANVIVGHPGETEDTLRTSAEYFRKLFLDERGTNGFLSVDPFRLYPGSPIDEDLDGWRERTGFRPHRYPWWHDGDQDFLAEWVDPSDSLDFVTTERLTRELIHPVVREIPSNFRHQGRAREYFMRAIRDQVALTRPARALRTASLRHLWSGLVSPVQSGEARERIRRDADLARVARDARTETLGTLSTTTTRIGRALIEVPRERFVPLEDMHASADDVAIALRPDALATVSAMHAYVAAYSLVGLSEGDHIVDLGAGTGYGAALAAHVVGEGGSVLAIEMDGALVSVARDELRDYPHVRVVEADAHETSLWCGATKVVCGFALRQVPEAWVDALAHGGVLVAPVLTDQGQSLVVVRKTRDGAHQSSVRPVRYVSDRSQVPAP
jgi:protein-L-isoaspartate(D-aspartate) O-methyltransferase